MDHLEFLRRRHGESLGRCLRSVIVAWVC